MTKQGGTQLSNEEQSFKSEGPISIVPLSMKQPQENNGQIPHHVKVINIPQGCLNQTFPQTKSTSIHFNDQTKSN